MLADKDTVAKLIPQQPPMVMVHGLIGHDEQYTRTVFTIEEGNIFVEDDYFNEAGLIENMAQSAALRTGWVSAGNKNVEKDFVPRVGVIGAIKNFELFRKPNVNSSLETTIELLTEFGSASLVSATVRQNEEVLASAELKIFLTGEEN
jgi:predicted hotdog family 3-hydroxylacyl-ACP dehydratase